MEQRKRITIKQARLKLGISQQEIAAKLDITPQQYGKWEKHPESLTVDKARRLCDVLHLRLEDIFFLSSDTF